MRDIQEDNPEIESQVFPSSLTEQQLEMLRSLLAKEGKEEELSSSDRISSLFDAVVYPIEQVTIPIISPHDFIHVYSVM
jgi:hypothetical protein